MSKPSRRKRAMKLGIGLANGDADRNDAKMINQ